MGSAGLDNDHQELVTAALATQELPACGAKPDKAQTQTSKACAGQTSGRSPHVLPRSGSPEGHRQDPTQ